MGRRSAGRKLSGASHAVLVAHPSRPVARPCDLSFDRRGVVLRAGSSELLRIPWWALEGLSADAVAASPDGRTVQVVRLVTDAGDLSLLLPAPGVTAVLASLGAWTARWRGSRRPLDRQVGRFLGYAGAVAGPLRRTARARAGVMADALPPPLRRIGREAARRPRAALATVCATVLTLAAWGGVALSGSAPAFGTPVASAAQLGHTFDASGMAQILQAAEFQAGAAAHLVRATAPPAPAPASVADAAPLSSHEVFGFAPYWSLGQEATFDVSGFTTLAYFAVGVNANGTLDESGTGWAGYESQDLANLVSRAHAAGDRVVLTVNCFSQGALNDLTSSPTAAATLAAAVVHAVSAKNLDGVNLDFEGEGSGDQAGLTALVATVSTAMHAANPHYQVTADTYASSAADPDGFYDIPALAKVVDGLFVMAYETNLDSGESAASPIPSAEYSNATAAAQYAAAVTPSKVIFGVPYFGYVWPTTNGTMSASAMGTGTPITYAQVVASGDPVYWDPVTDSAWTSYQVGHQWYEAYVDDPTSVYMVAQLAQREGFAGVGAWALGMDGNSAQMTTALDGDAPPERAGPAGPASTSSSAGATSSGTTKVPSIPGVPGGAVPGDGAPGGGVPATTPTTQPSAGGGTAGGSGGTGGTGGTGSGSSTETSTAVWGGQTVALTLEPTVTPSGTATLLGSLSGFSTTDPALHCLAATSAGIAVWHYPGAGTDLAIARQPTNCADAEFTFVPGSAAAGSGSGSGSGSGGGTGAVGVTAGAAGVSDAPSQSSSAPSTS